MLAYKFEKVSKFKDQDFNMPRRKTTGSAGYDFVVVEDTIIPPYNQLMANLDYTIFKDNDKPEGAYDLNKIAALTKATGAKPTLVSTGVKAYMPKDIYLELSVRSSCPLKYWIIMANGVGIIDSDYADNSDNEGEIFFQLINLSPVPIILHKGDIIGQGIFKPYFKTSSDEAIELRTGGFGSTDAQK